MRRALALLLIATPAAAAPHGPGCQLTTAQCVQVAQEIAVQAELDAEDARTFGFGLSPYERTRELIQRKYDRRIARAARLPVAIGNELSRLQLCAVEDSDAARDGTTNGDLRCH